MNQQYNYTTNRNVQFEHLDKIDILPIVEACKDTWFNQALTIVNESIVRLGIVLGEYHWHKHEHDDEFFFVLSGRLLVDLEDQTIELGPNEGVTIPKGELHRTRAETKTIVLMVEGSTTEPTGD